MSNTEQILKPKASLTRLKNLMVAYYKCHNNHTYFECPEDDKNVSHQLMLATKNITKNNIEKRSRMDLCPNGLFTLCWKTTECGMGPPKNLVIERISLIKFNSKLQKVIQNTYTLHIKLT
nr:hypothetical protein [uncultured Psychroserpens sp.]